jgi:DNA-binding transcriptional MerR regulator
MKIGELAKRLGTSVSALRFYEQQGLVKPRRTEGGTRQYTEENLKRFQALLALASLDVPLDRIRALTLIRPSSNTGDAASKQVETELAHLEEELETMRERLEHAEADIKLARRRLSGCHQCKKQPVHSVCHDCSVAERLLECEVMQIVWDK